MYSGGAWGPATQTRLTGEKLLCVDADPTSLSVVVGGESGFLAVLPRALARSFSRPTRRTTAPPIPTAEQEASIESIMGKAKPMKDSAPTIPGLEPALEEPKLPTGSISLAGHLLDVNSSRFIANGAAILSASSDMSVRIWSASTGHCGAILRGHTAGVTSAIPIGAGRTVVSESMRCDAIQCYALWRSNPRNDRVRKRVSCRRVET